MLFHLGFPCCRVQAQPLLGLAGTKVISSPEFLTWRQKTRTFAVVSGRILGLESKNGVGVVLSWGVYLTECVTW